MKAVIISDSHQSEGRQAMQRCGVLQKRSPWLQTECVDLSSDATARERYHLGRNQSSSYIIFDDNGKEVIRGAGVIPEKYITALVHEYGVR